MKSITISTVVNSDMKIMVATDGNYTAFAGVAKNNTFNIERSFDRVGELLVRAVNNRTRERNFFRLYSDLLEHNITEDEYSHQLEEYQDEFVLPLPVEADMTDIETAVQLSRHIKGVESMDDFQSLFHLVTVLFNPFEVILRNAVNEHYMAYYSDSDWIVNQADG